MAASPSFHDFSSLFVLDLPDHCDPTTPLLKSISSYSQTCIPTPLAFISTLLGTLSIISWLFAQLPQIVTNYRLKSTSGLSAFFLIEWLLGVISNLLGAVLTNQATWQVIIGGYYCFVDIMLVGQWVWYEALNHGRPLKKIWLSKIRRVHSEISGGDRRARDSPRIIERVEPVRQPFILESEEDAVTQKSRPDPANDATSPQDIPLPKARSASSMFHTPIYGFLSPSVTAPGTPQASVGAVRTIHRAQNPPPGSSRDIPTGSPRAMLYTSTLLALASSSLVRAASASPLADSSLPSGNPEEASPDPDFLMGLGTGFAWASSFLYLASRLPQLLQNLRRQSTAGLSPTLFLAAFCGNFFYSSSLLLNPLAWHSFGPYGGHGWADPGGSDRAEWLKAALPFWLGAAGVLVMDGAVGLQFIMYRQRHGAEAGEEEVLIVRDEDRKRGQAQGRKLWKGRRVSGWMRGWQPGVSGKIDPVLGRRESEVRSGERDALLNERGAGKQRRRDRYGTT